MSHVLMYDTLPAHSHLRREVVEGLIKITAAPEEPGPLLRRKAAQEAALAAGAVSAVVLVVALAALGATWQQHRRLISSGLSTALVIAVAVFCGSLFVLVWRVQYLGRLHALRRALQQATVLAAGPGRLVIETAGPFGAASHDVRASPEAPIIREFRRARCGSDRGPSVECLQIILGDGSSIHVLPGRDEIELRWVARMLAEASRMDSATGAGPQRLF